MDDLHHQIRGDGPALLLLHGTGSAHTVWDRVVDGLSARRCVLAVDLPGFGASPPLDVEPSPRNLAGAVAGLLDRVGLDRCDVVGHSLGGFVAMELAAAGRARSVAAVSPAGMLGPLGERWAKGTLLSLHALGRLLRPTIPTLARSGALRTVLLGPLFSQAWKLDVDELLRATDAYLDSPDIARVIRATPARMDPGRIAGIECPVLLLWGGRDLLLPPPQAVRWANAVPHAELRWLERLGHTPMLEDPAAVTAALLDFLDRASPA